MVKKNRVASGILAMACALTLAQTAFAETVTLQSGDGTVNMTGEFVAFRNNAYFILTDVGEMRVSADRVSCSGDACPSTQTAGEGLLIGGSDTVGLGLMPLLIEGYAGELDAAADIVSSADGRELRIGMIGDQGFGDDLGAISVSSTTSGDGFAKLTANEVLIGMSSRRIRPEEARTLRDLGAGNMVSPSQEHIVAVDSLILITNPENPIRSLTTEEVRQIYTGQINNWSEVGGEDMAINVVSLPETSGTRSVFQDRMFGEAAIELRTDLMIAESNAVASEIVSEDIGAVAYVSYAFQRGANAVTLVNECGIGMTPDAFSARTEEYALQRRLYLYSREDTMTAQGNAFIEFATSAEADRLIGKAGFIGFAVDRRTQAMDSDRAVKLLDPAAGIYEGGFMRQMLGQMVDFDRLSTTFRFNTGSSRLDARGRIDKERLIRYLEDQPEGTEVLMVGFTDTVGQFDGNLGLSTERANIVAREVAKSAGDRLPHVTVNARGFGELAPVACNDTDKGRSINRRVEVWIKSPV